MSQFKFDKVRTVMIFSHRDTNASRTITCVDSPKDDES